MTGTVMRWLILLCLLSTLDARGQAAWTWKDSKGVVRPRAELDSIIADHRKWAESKGAQGKRANLSGADLDHAVLTGADLSGANLSNVDLTKANLSGANLQGADLTGASLSGGEPGLKGALLGNANLNGAQLAGANLTNADLSGAKLGAACLSAACVSDTTEEGKADLEILKQSGGTGTDLEFAELYHAIYEPTASPEPWLISSALHLSDLTYIGNPAPLVGLRNSLRDAGNVQPERDVNEAFHRHDPNSPPGLPANPLQNRRRPPPQWLKDVLYWHQKLVYWYQQVAYWIGEVLNWLQQVMFDWTCGWGADPGRPLVIIGVMALLCTPIYWIGMHFERGSSGLFLVATGERIATAKSKERVLRICVSPAWRVAMKEQTPLVLGPKDWGLSIWRARKKWLRLETRALRTALLFSLMSVFNIGFEGFNGGQWIRAIQMREFDIRARGWMRTTSGLQSLFGVGLLALSILSYFGRPFE
jgi:Pentapeptide repeats (8 copies)